MALPQQLKTARMSNATVGNTIDNNVGALEQALADIFGFTVNVDITASPFTLDNSGRITKALVAQRAAGPVGWRMRDTTSGKEVRIVVNGTNLDIDENTGSEGTPTWTNRLRIAVATGALTGAVATTSRMGLCPAGDSDSTKFLDGTMAFSVPSLSGVPTTRVRNSGAQGFASGSAGFFVFDTEDWDTDTMHSTVTNNSRITCVTAGKYYFIGACLWQANSSGYRQLQLIKNGTDVFGYSTEAPVSAVAHGQQVRGAVDLIAGDYVQMKGLQTSGSTINSTVGATYAPFLSAYKIS